MVEGEALSPGHLLGRYELLAQVARGGMGQVWVARLCGARGFQKVVAVKTLLPELRDDKRLEEMLLAEARIASLIHHPNVAQTTELGEHQGTLYIVMEWVDGESLSFVLKRAEERGWMPVPVGVNLIAQACRGLHAAHELTSDLGVHLGVVHRDVSPHNMLVTHSGQVKLVDFGIAKATNEESSLTANGEIKGKYSFMAPEQVTGGDVDRRADVFALGIVLYLLVTGRHPFKVDPKVTVVASITSDKPAPPPSRYLSSCAPALEAVIMKALEKDPARRYQTAEAMRQALENAMPQAFAPRFDLQVREFLGRTMGDRALARREAMRRFQLAADERQVTAAGIGLAAPIPSQSGGSLRAILVPNGASVQVADARPSDMPTQLGTRRRSRAWLVALSTAALVGVGAFAAVRSLLPLTRDSATTSAPAAASPVAPEPLPPAEASPSPSTTSPAPSGTLTAAPSPPGTASSETGPATAATASSAALGAKAPALKPATGASEKAPIPPASARPARAKRPPKATPLDLMTPYDAK